MAKKQLRVGMIGYGFMGRAHSNAWSQVNKFFELPRRVTLATIAARDALELAPFARKWGWSARTSRHHRSDGPARRSGRRSYRP